MFTEKGQALVDRAKTAALSKGAPELDLSAFVMAITASTECRVLLAECLGIPLPGIPVASRQVQEKTGALGKMSLASPVHEMLSRARELAREVPDRNHPGLIDQRHVLCAMAMSHRTCAELDIRPVDRKTAISHLAGWYDRDGTTTGIDVLVDRLRSLRANLLDTVFGQDHAVHAFVEGLFNAEVVAAADASRKTPRAVFVFAGPPGVGKTFLAETGASHLERPVKRFDMSSYSNVYQVDSLVGVAKSFQGAHAGLLTEFVEANPASVLIFDEIEKCHPAAIHLFLQILDGGVLEDRFHERNVQFRETTIILTTNAGRKLYDRPNQSGVNSANASFHRKTILDALETEVNPHTHEPFFPASICSRIATGYPLLFNYLKVNELERVVEAELRRCASLFERQYYKRVSFHDLIPVTLVLREGARADARTIRAQAEAFVKTEIFKFCQLFKRGGVDEALAKIDDIEFALDPEADMAEDVAGLFESGRQPKVLLVAGTELGHLYSGHVTEVEWRLTTTPADALQVLANEDVDLVLLDLWLDRRAAAAALESALQFDSVPATSRGLEQGQELLRMIHERLPGLPVYLLSLTTVEQGEKASHAAIDDELFMACVRGGGARGMIQTRLVGKSGEDWEASRDTLAAELIETARRLHRERAAERMGEEHKLLTFTSVPHLRHDGQQVTFRLRNLRLSRAVAAADAGEILADVERPRVRFEDVIGAGSAKEELQFFIDYLKAPRRFSALGIKPPRGVLLYGPPGTGKTMLARALAGESNVAFVPAAASTFVTKWQGSGPESVRELFDRARRYAPAILFIDEIDAVGKVRTGGQTGHGEEMALNALLTEMDGFTSTSPDRPLFILAATNFNITSDDPNSPDRSLRTLDPALVRRFSRAIFVDLPDTATRKSYLRKRLQEGREVPASSSAIDLLAEKSAGMSIAALEQVIESAARSALKRETKLSDEILIEELDTAREGEAKEWSPSFLESTARHEAGHTILYWLSGWFPSEVSIVARAAHGGGMRRCEAETKRESLSCKDILNQIRTLLGGRAAEQLYSGAENGLTTGASGDLAQATRLARDMVCRYGMTDDFGLLAVPELIQHPEGMASPLYEQVNVVISEILKREMINTRQLLNENKQALDRVVSALLVRNRLLRSELEEILGPYERDTVG